MIRHVIRGIAIAAGVAAVPLALAVPGSTEIVWGDNHIGNQAGAPTAAGAPFGYTTNLTGQGRPPALSTGPPAATSKN